MQNRKLSEIGAILTTSIKKKQDCLFVATNPRYNEIIAKAAAISNSELVQGKWQNGYLTNWAHRKKYNKVLPFGKNKFKIARYQENPRIASSEKFVPKVAIFAGSSSLHYSLQECQKIGTLAIVVSEETKVTSLPESFFFMGAMPEETVSYFLFYFAQKIADGKFLPSKHQLCMNMEVGNSEEELEP